MCKGCISYRYVKHFLFFSYSVVTARKLHIALLPTRVRKLQVHLRKCVCVRACVRACVCVCIHCVCIRVRRKKWIKKVCVSAKQGQIDNFHTQTTALNTRTHTYTPNLSLSAHCTNTRAPAAHVPAPHSPPPFRKGHANFLFSAKVNFPFQSLPKYLLFL